jgi:parallel beta-helix repeat protein
MSSAPAGALDVTTVGAVGDGTTDDTNALAHAATVSSSLFFPAGVYVVSELTLGPDTTVVGAPNAVLKGKAGATTAVLVLTAGDRIDTLEIDGNEPARPDGSCIEVHGGPGVTLSHVFVHDCRAKGITFANSAAFSIDQSHFARCDDACVDLSFSPGGSVTHSVVQICKHGIQWWGGDSATTDTAGISDLTISDNTVTDVSGGCIWGSLGRRITVQDNSVAHCGDVGIDLEGTSDSTVTGNTVSNATNGGITTFYGSSAVNIGSNVVQQVGAEPGIKFFGTKLSSTLVVDGNKVSTADGIGLTMDQGIVASVTVSNNTFVVTGAAAAIRMLDAQTASISKNTLTVSGPTGISFEGPSDGLIADNTIHTTSDTSGAPGDHAGIFLPWRSAAFPTKRNDVHGNVVSGFFSSVDDDCWGDLASANSVTQNQVDGKIYRRAGSGWTGTVAGNQLLSNPAVVVGVDTY